jgi:hypothetical protein
MVFAGRKVSVMLNAIGYLAYQLMGSDLVEGLRVYKTIHMPPFVITYRHTSVRKL